MPDRFRGTVPQRARQRAQIEHVVAADSSDDAVLTELEQVIAIGLKRARCDHGMRQVSWSITVRGIDPKPT